jgi:hypothetical protein
MYYISFLQSLNWPYHKVAVIQIDVIFPEHILTPFRFAIFRRDGRARGLGFREKTIPLRHSQLFICHYER